MCRRRKDASYGSVVCSAHVQVNSEDGSPAYMQTEKTTEHVSERLHLCAASGYEPCAATWDGWGGGV